jgi:4-amino-4-deoxy-L-arabinose transferase-like glycosyltransferase
MDGVRSVSPKNLATGWLLAAAVAALIVIGYRMWSLPLLSPDEGRNAEVAREMKESGAWLVPTYNQLPYLDKPAFYFRTVALSLTVFGDNHVGARMPSALFALAVLILVWRVADQFCGPRPGALAVLVTATTPLFISQARIVIFDMSLCLFVSGAIFAGFMAETGPPERRRRGLLLAAGCAGVATLIKGPVGLIVPLLVLAVFHVASRQWSAFGRLFHPLNALVYVVVVLPWFLGVTLHHPDFPDYGLVQESFKRFTTGQFHRKGPAYYYALVMPATFLPWSLLLPGGLWLVYTVGLRYRKLSPLNLLLVLWCLVVLGFFSLSQSKLPGYILSVSVPFGILVGQVLDRALSDPQSRSRRVVLGAGWALLGIVGLLLLGVLVVAPQTGILPSPIRVKRFEISQFAPFLPELLVLLVAVGGVLVVGLTRRWTSWCIAGFGLFPVFLVLLGGGIFHRAFDEKSAQAVAAAMPRLDPGTQLVFYQCFPNGLPFYLRRTGVLITADGDELTSNYALYKLKRESSWPAQIVPVKEADAWMQRRQGDAYVMTHQGYRAWLQGWAERSGGAIENLPHGFLGLRVR